MQGISIDISAPASEPYLHIRSAPWCGGIYITLTTSSPGLFQFYL